MRAPITAVLLGTLSLAAFGQVPELMWFGFDEGGGTTTANAAPAATAVGNANALVTGHELTPGVGCGGSGALRGFMGFDNYVETGWHPNLPAGSPWSVGFFIDWTGVSVPVAPPYILFGTYDPNGGPTLRCKIDFNNTAPSLSLERTDGNMSADTFAVFSPGRHLIVWAYDPASGLVRVYVDGVNTNNGGLSPILPGFDVGPGQTLRIGGRSPTEFAQPYDLLVDDFRFFSHKLTQSEINSWLASCGAWSPFIPPPPPPNDACNSAIPVSLGVNGPFTTSYATTTPGWNGCGGSPSGNDVFFSFTPSMDGDYAISSCAIATPLASSQHHRTMVSVHAGYGTGCATLYQAFGGCSTECEWGGAFANGAQLGRIAAVNLLAGLPYVIRVADHSGYYRGTFHLTIAGPPPVPANDDCANATPLPQTGSVAGNNASAGSTVGLPQATCVSGVSREVWYSYTYPGTCATVTTTLSLCGSTTIDTVLTVYSGTCGNLALVACNDDGCTGTNASVLTFSPVPGVSYLIAVQSWALSPGGPFTLSVTTHAGSLQSTGFGCGPIPPPTLSANVPTVGAPFNIQLAWGGANATGVLLVAAGPGGPTVLPGGCSVLLDPNGIVMVPLVTNAAGSWSLSVPIPSGPPFPCLSGKLQAATQNAAGNWWTSQVLSFTIGG